MPSRKSSRHKQSPSVSNNGDAARTQSSPVVEVRHSSVHGRGVYATQLIPKGARIIEYTGKRMSWADVPNDDDDPHTFIFGLDNGQVINAEIDGNEARWINHSCDPNCEAVGKDDRMFIYALRKIRTGEELFYDYSLQLDEPITKELVQEYKCDCGASRCRGTMLEVKKGTRAAGRRTGRR
jgi:SET domain-containing protein